MLCQWQIDRNGQPALKWQLFQIPVGGNDFQKFKTRDLPPMQIKDIKISEKDILKYYWPLDETSGDVCYDRISHKTAKVQKSRMDQSQNIRNGKRSALSASMDTPASLTMLHRINYL